MLEPIRFRYEKVIVIHRYSVDMAILLRVMCYGFDPLVVQVFVCLSNACLEYGTLCKR